MKRTWKYVCKYTPLELLAGFDIQPELLNATADSHARADRCIHSNVCSYSRALVENRMRDPADPIILTTCCDSMERTADVLKSRGQAVYVLSLPHDNGCCGREMYRRELLRLMDQLREAAGTAFDMAKFRAACRAGRPGGGSPEPAPERSPGRYMAVMGSRVNTDLMDLIQRECPLPVRNSTCTGVRSVREPPAADDLDAVMAWYAGELLSQTPCMRMLDVSGRRALAEDPNLCGIIYSTVSFCDFYTHEYSRLRSALNVPILKIETDYTRQAAEQLKTRLRAFFESLGASPGETMKRAPAGHAYYAGIDSGSTSTNVVILDDGAKIVSFAIVPTGARVAESAQRAMDEALRKAGITLRDVRGIVATGYGRERIDFRTRDVTEITCHAKGAHFLHPKVRTVIDIGGQDSKVIKLDADGSVCDFVMNDKCAAGTGRFIEMMAQSLQLSLAEMSVRGLRWSEDITISSMCSVFAQSEVVSLIASGKRVEDIIHGIHSSIAARVVSMGRRVKLEPEFMMTGGVARNTGVVRAIEERLGAPVIVPQEPDLCGALGAALIAREDCGA